MAVASYQANFKNLQTQLDAVQARLSTLNTNDVLLVAFKHAFDIARRVGDTDTLTATLNIEVAAQSGRITEVTGRNTTLMASRNVG